MYIERIAEYRKAKATQKRINIQLNSEIYNTLHEDSSKKLFDDPLWGEVQKKEDPKGLMIAVLVRKHASRHLSSTNDVQCSTSKREGNFTILLLQDYEIHSHPSFSRI